MECLTNSCPATLTPPASHLFFTLINALMASQCALGPENRYPPDYSKSLNDGDEFDFIVIGAGSAGSIVANRLSQVEKWKVLLLEAGDYPSALSEIPAMVFSVQDTPEDWQYKMEPSKTCCLSLKGNICVCPRGKAVGGSSILNAMIYVRGNPNDFNTWAAAGNEDWDYKTVVKHFKKFENCQDPNDNHYGKNGELEITRYKSQQPIRDILVDAYKELGYYQEYQEENSLGFMDSYMTISNGMRSSAGKSFIGKIKDRKNLYVVVNAQVGKLLINKTQNIVYGVEVKVNGRILKINARNEVILSAGSINSPQILMNSGIGPKEHLEDLGIELVQNLSVGENLQNHFSFPFFINIDKSVVNPKSDSETIDELYNFFMHRKGPLSEIDITNFMGFINVKNDSMYPNLQLFHTVHYPDDQYLLPVISKSFNIPEEILTVFQEHNKHNSNMLLLPSITKPKSVGRVRLNSADSFDKPLIYPNYLSDEKNEDLELLLEGIKMFQRLVKTETLKKYKAEIVEYTLPNCQKFSFGTDDFWKCAIRNIGTNFYHEVGSCKMGPREDLTAVVDSKLRVHGIKGLRVIDGSVMPTITSANTNPPIIMIGERGAEFIKKEWLSEYEEL
ncbi:hypothetical protein ILUMI_08394 [Ignelater luminosus]|uniref:Glucose-methanol-choline oxidoreductase N-terminal domain-containing protein n=1 Tax=Ignelater luminosus TaxID=2038154 RepID=A0A8K0D6Z3_IGNLU|nr:hypothetical protein ILUMI_08394 [Ignelater luminosus]